MRLRKPGASSKGVKMPAKARSRPMPQSLLGRMLTNTVWLLGGKGFGAICSLLYLAILTRTLGIKGFGHFSLIFGTSQALVALAGFQTWRIVVRYGAEYVHTKNWAAFGRLSALCGILDFVGAVTGTLIAWVVFYQFSDALDINPHLVHTAFWFNVAAMWAMVSAPTGIVRALDRFDAATYVEAIVPISRLISAVVIWLTGPSLVRFLIAWAVIDLIEAALYWLLARRLAPEAINLRVMRGWRQALTENVGIVRFFLVTFATSTVDAAIRNGPLLAVGYFAGTKAAGLFRLAQQLSQGLGKLSTLLTRSAYAEIARARFAAAYGEFRKLVVQTSLLAGGASAIVVLLAVFLGKQLLALLGGDDFGAAHAILIPLTIGAAFDLASVAFEPVLHSTGNARQALAAKLLSLCFLAASVAILAPVHEAIGIGWAIAIAGAAAYVFAGIMAWRKLDDPPVAPGT